MTVRRDPDGRWRYRVKIFITPDNRPRLCGTAPKDNNTKAAATQAEREHIARVQQEASAAASPARDREGNHVELKIVPSPPVITFRDFAAGPMKGYAETNNKRSEQTSKETVFRVHLNPSVGDLPLDQIRVKEIEALKAELLAKDLARKTVNNILIVLSKALHYAKELELLREVPPIRMLKVDKAAFRFLDFEEYAALLNAAQAEPLMYLAILLGGDAGLRKGEIRALRWDDWDRQHGRIKVTRSYWRDSESMTKGWDIRSIPLSPRLRAALVAAQHQRGRTALATERGEPLEVDPMDQALKRLCKRARIQVVGWHALRHTFCSHLAMHGAPARVIQELAGHKQLSTTLKYMHLVPGAAEHAIALLELPPPIRSNPCPIPLGTAA